MTAFSSSRTLLLGLAASFTLAAAARADIVGRESDITDLRLGQKVYVDDGACPAGQIKEVSGLRLGASGTVESVKKCVDRKGKR